MGERLKIEGVKPPYYAVIFTWVCTDGDNGYAAKVAREYGAGA